MEFEEVMNVATNYTKKFTKPYPNGYKDKPDKTTPVTAAILNMQDDTFTAIEDYLSNLEMGLPDDVEINRSILVGNKQDGASMGTYAVANGTQCTASGDSSHAEGAMTSATEFVSHAEGIQTKATGQAAHAEGVLTEASGSIASHAEGQLSKATGTMAHAEGYNTVASGAGSHAEGYNTLASGTFQHAQGKYNVEDTEEEYAHIVGGGTSDTDRKNIFTLDWYGNAKFAGDVSNDSGVSLNGLDYQIGCMSEEISAVEEDITTTNDELTSQGKAIGELADKKITKFYASSQGDTTLNDSDSGKMQDMMLYGKSTQAQYSGKNLLNCDKATVQTINGVTFTPIYDNNILQYIDVNGTATANINYLLSDNKFDDNLVLNGCPAGGSSTSYCLKYQNWDSSWENMAERIDSGNGATTINRSESVYFYTRIFIQSGYTANNLKFYPMIRSTDSTDTSFEPYVGAIPSPNPDYPQEIKSVVEPVVKVMGKNLFDGLLEQGNSVNSTTTNRVKSTNFVSIKKGEKYCISIKNNTDFSIALLSSTSKGYPLGSNIECGTKGVFQDSGIDSFTATKDGYLSFVLKRQDAANITPGDFANVNILLEKGTTIATSYEPYQEQSVTLSGITLNAIPVSSGGNVTIDEQQYVADYVDVERGKIVRMVRKVVLNGSETWTAQSASAGSESKRMWALTIIGAIKTGSSSKAVGALCSHFEENTPTFTYNNEKDAFSISEDGERFQFRKLGVSAAADWKSWLSENNITVYYPLAIPTEESLPDELAEKLKSLQTYYPQTNLFITSGQLDGYAIFNYPISLAQGWNYVKQQIGDTRDYIYDMDLQMAQAYVNSEYAVALTELEV